jgi:2-polyprenyl-3-methyl-5-hydroxy-6-metoxy-1,4-benzoquinol methylase
VPSAARNDVRRTPPAGQCPQPGAAPLPADPYRSHCRKDLLPFVPAEARSVLSVGCGRGATEAELVRRGIEVVGIELDPLAAVAAHQHGVIVLEGEAGQLHSELTQRRFDCLIYGDILEHLLDPLAVLRSHVALLEPGGTVIVSVPNFRHISVFVQLFLRGHVRYADAGIFDRTHVRITTRKMVLAWFAECNLHPVCCRFNVARRRDMLVSACLLGLPVEFLAGQVIVVGRKPHSDASWPPPGSPRPGS